MLHDVLHDVSSVPQPLTAQIASEGQVTACYSQNQPNFDIFDAESSHASLNVESMQ